MAIANSLHAISLGIEWVDASLQGLGRSAGNACTEVLVAVLNKRGYNLDINILGLQDIGYTYIYPLLQNKGIAPLDLTAGISDFHSSYMPKVIDCAKKYDIDPRLLIEQITRKSKIDLPESQELDRMAAQIRLTHGALSELIVDKYYLGGEQEPIK
jgi:isopropylmalate/homocitrate/citramalate synthase